MGDLFEFINPKSGAHKNLDNQNIMAATEALLFVYGEPMEIGRISGLLKTDEAVVREALKNLEAEYLAEKKGLKLIFQGNQVQLVSKPEFAPLLEGFIKEEFREQLTPASLETLALIVYLGPLSKAQIDYYRGVNSGFILRSLLIRGLVERYSAPKGNVYLYQPSFDLLKYLGISKIEELPEYERFKTMTIDS